MRIRVLGMIVLCVFSAACARLQIRPSRTIVQAAPIQSAQQGGSTFDWTAWSYWECTVNWQQYCVMDDTLKAPSGWQVCKPYYRIASAGKGGPTFSARMNPDYVTAVYHFYVEGSGKWWDQWGSHLRVEDVGVKLISAPTTPAQRQAAGCLP